MNFGSIFYEVQMGYKKSANIYKQRKADANEKPVKILDLQHFNRFVCCCFVVFCASYFPIQKFAKIFPSNSSLVTSPVMFPK